MNNNLSKALELHKMGKLDEAENIYLDLLGRNKDRPTVLQLLGTLNLQKKKFSLSEDYFLKNLELEPNNPNTLNNLGILKKQIKEIEKSIEYFDLNIKKNDFIKSWINKSNILLENKRFEEGLEFSKKALIKYPDNREIKNNFAIFLYKCGFQKEALSIYKEFDEKNLHFNDSYVNYCNILIEVNNLNKALQNLNNLLLLDEKNLNGLRQRHFVYKCLSNYSKAEEDLLRAIDIKNLDFLSIKMLVEFYIDIKKFEKAIIYCDLMISKNIEKNFFITKKIISQIHIGSWMELRDNLLAFNQFISEENLAINPLALKYINDEALLQKKISEKFWEQLPKNKYLHKISSTFSKEIKKNKINIGYFSGDYGNHAVFNLIQDLFVNQDKSDFETFAYSTFKRKGQQRDKIKEHVDNFFDLDDLDDETILKLIKSHNLDVAVDLSGYTANNKSHLFEYNISRVKVNYLGFPGSMGSKKYDYIIADKNIIKEDELDKYSEKVLFMPEIYQPFTPKVFNMNIKKSEFDLPEDKFILGCFSRIEKILPNIFDIWMKVMIKNKDAKLALCIQDERVKNNIKIYCNKNQFNFSQIIFLNNLDHKENLKRISTFDLYLDTFPYNGHTAISDSLFQSCVPTISFTGNSFASRVSYSLLKHLKLDNLVTYDEHEYYNKINYYCSNRDELKKIREYLINFKENNKDRMKKFTKDFERIIKSTISMR